MDAIRTSLLVVLLAAGTVSAQSEARHPFPMQPIDALQESVLELSPLPDLMAGLTNYSEVTLADVPLPDGSSIDLDVHRVTIASGPIQVLVDGEVTVPDVEDMTMWSGENAYLAFSQHGSWGWVRSGDGDLIHLVSVPGAGNDWTASRARMVPESVLESLGAGPPDATCELDTIEQPFAPERPPLSGQSLGGAEGGSAFLPLYEGRIAVETDFQFYELFGDLTAAQGYLFALFGAVSDRYRDQIGTILTMPYVAFYTTNTDPWVQQDIGGNCIDVLYEFRDAWDAGAAPVSADLYHLVSGESLGCGVAYLDVLCDPDFGFSVSGSLDGVTPIPIVPFHPLNWDFVVFAHELGHNFATSHTHNYCPPIDECAPDGYWGSCQDEQACISDGTIMSYCHLCSGGFGNVTTLFHPDVAQVMRDGVTSSCMPLFKGVFPNDLGFSMASANGTPELDVSFTADPDTLHFDVTDGPSSSIGTFIASGIQANLPFKGGIMVPQFDFVLPLSTDGSGAGSLDPAVSLSLPDGVFIYTQVWWKEGGGDYAATNGVEFELILP